MVRSTVSTTIAIIVAVVAVGALVVCFPGLDGGSGDDARNTPNTAWLQEVAQGEMTQLTPVEPGAVTPDLPFVDASGTAFTLDDFKGKVVLVNFWATWCAPCRAEMPALDRLHQALGGDDFTVLAISIDRGGAEAAQPFLDEIGVSALPTFYDARGRLTRAWGVYGLPVTVLMDREGREIARLVGPAEWDSDDAKAIMRYAIDL